MWRHSLQNSWSGGELSNTAHWRLCVSFLKQYQSITFHIRHEVNNTEVRHVPAQAWNTQFIRFFYSRIWMKLSRGVPVFLIWDTEAPPTCFKPSAFPGQPIRRKLALKEGGSSYRGAKTAFFRGWTERLAKKGYLTVTRAKFKNKIYCQE